MKTVVKLCSRCMPQRAEQLSKHFGGGECEACSGAAELLTGFWLDTLCVIARNSERGAAETAKRNMGDLWFRNDVLGVDLWYPRPTRPGEPPREFDHPVSVEVGLSDVRAADSIRIDYDFERDGYSVKQASKFSWTAEDQACDEDWQEAAFVQAWAREVDPDDGDVETQRLLNHLNVAHTNAKVALAALPPADPDKKNVLLDISRGQLQAAVSHLEQAWNDLTEATKKTGPAR